MYHTHIQVHTHIRSTVFVHNTASFLAGKISNNKFSSSAALFALFLILSVIVLAYELEQTDDHE